MSNASTAPIRVLIADDSATVRAFLEGVLAQMPAVELAGVARDGQQAVQMALGDHPDVILMDLHMPRMDGLAAITRIMAHAPCPIIVLSGVLTRTERDLAFEALKAGALDVLHKPRDATPTTVEDFSAQLGRRIQRYAGMHLPARPQLRPPSVALAPEVAEPADAARAPGPLLLIGASTGGPRVLRDLLDGLPRPLPAGVVIAQHLTPGFEASLASWLAGSGHDVTVATGGTQLLPDRVIIVPATHHGEINGDRLVLHERGEVAVGPSVDRLFKSAAASVAERSVAVLLTGMGRDGAEGLLALRGAGAQTLVQQPDTCVVGGMPRSAIDRDAAQWIGTPAELPAAIFSAIARVVAASDAP